ncbi:hypothetical protein BX667DRAFT_219003 [Coemansia mojavensis]|nr:hypothetical protein BX667DRAFT_219003 [Coemansia mojavensis]
MRSRFIFLWANRICRSQKARIYLSPLASLWIFLIALKGNATASSACSTGTTPPEAQSYMALSIAATMADTNSAVRRRSASRARSSWSAVAAWPGPSSRAGSSRIHRNISLGCSPVNCASSSASPGAPGGGSACAMPSMLGAASSAGAASALASGPASACSPLSGKPVGCVADPNSGASLSAPSASTFPACAPLISTLLICTSLISLISLIGTLSRASAANPGMAAAATQWLHA